MSFKDFYLIMLQSEMLQAKYFKWLEHKDNETSDIVDYYEKVFIVELEKYLIKAEDLKYKPKVQDDKKTVSASNSKKRR